MKLGTMYSFNIETYSSEVKVLLRTILNKLNKVCYISLNKTGESVMEFCRENGIDEKKIVVIDMISSRFMKLKPRKNVFFINLDKFPKIMDPIIKIIEKEKCEGLIFDSLSTLEIYFDQKNFLQFIHELLVYSESEHLISNVIVQKEDLHKDWVRSLIPVVGEVKEVKFKK